MDDLPVQALQVATEDFFGGSRPPGRPCSEGRGAYRYRVIRQGEVVFVKIVATPRQCGMEILSHDGATYAIGPDGKILHRHLGASLFDDYDGDPDGGHPASPEQIDVFEGDPAVVPPVEFFTRDAGADPDGGPGPGAVVEPGAETRPDAGTPR